MVRRFGGFAVVHAAGRIRQPQDPRMTLAVVTSRALDGLEAPPVQVEVQLANGQGAIIITHDPADAVELGARVLLMRDGRVVADATPAAIAKGERGDWAKTFLNAGD